MHYSKNDLPWLAVKGQHAATATVTLKKGESAWNPASTNRPIYGPCKVQYIAYEDGGIDATVS